MLSLFPSLLSYEQLSPFLIRITLGAILLYWAYRKLADHANGTAKVLGIGEAVVGAMLIVGIWTQLAALVSAIAFFIALIKKAKQKALLSQGVNYFLILFILSLSLLFTGAGFLAFDIPL